MVKKYLPLLFSLASLTASATSEHHLTAEQALQRVKAAMPEAIANDASAAARHRAPGNTESPLYYVFNLEGGGYVITSADDRARTILGRCDEGQWDADNVPPAMQGWLESMSEGLLVLAQSDADVPASATTDACLAAAPERAAAVRVEPLLKLDGEGEILWGQNTPFNNLCPASGSTHSATGCAATAMAQIMRYHRWPAQGRGSNSYDTSTIGDSGSKTSVSDTFEGVSYDWSNMLTQYYLTTDGRPSNYNDTQATAVATLMRHIGVASNMDYNTGASGTTEGPMLKAMIENFDYDRSLQIYYRENYTSADWYALLQSEIDAQRPVLMNGYSVSGGHAFVIDGYDTQMGNGYFHFNWGWNGMSNGYYSVDITDPGEQGTGGSLGGYSHNQNIFTNIKPQAGGTAKANLCITEALKYSREQIYFAFLNRGTGSFTGEVGYVVEQDGQTAFTSLATMTNATFSQGGNYHFAPAVSKAGARVYAAYRLPNGTIQPMTPIVGTPSVLVSQMNGSKLTFVAESADMPALEVASISIAGGEQVSYVGHNTTFDVMIKNTGAAEYNGPLYLCITELDDNGQPTIEEYHTADNPLGVYIRPGESNSYQLTYYSETYLLAGHQYSAEVIYNPRNSSSFVHIPGAKLVFDVELYQPSTGSNPPVITISKQSLSTPVVEQGGELTVNAKFYNKGGIDPVKVGAAIFAEKGNTILATLGVSTKSIAKEMSDHTFTGVVDLAPGKYRLLLGYDDDGVWEFFGYNYLYFNVVEPQTDPEPGDTDIIITEEDKYNADFDGDDMLTLDDLEWLVGDILWDWTLPEEDLDHNGSVGVGDVTKLIYMIQKANEQNK